MTVLRKFLLAIGLLGIALTVTAQTAEVTASVDRTSVRINESFNYVLRAEGAARGEPDVSVVARDFDILGRTSTTSVRITGGRAEQIAEWQFQLMPRREGTFEIPPVSLAGALSNPVQIEVLAAQTTGDSSSADVFMEIEAQPETAFVQSQIVVVIRLFVGIRTQRATWTAPQVAGGEAIVEKIGSDSQYTATRSGRDYEVLERRFAVFPQESGRLLIGPATFEGTVVASGLPRVQRYRSDVLQMDVLPAVAPPPEYPGATWLPATELRLSELWRDDEPALSQGIPQTRTIVIEADGLLETQLPELDLPQGTGLRQYSDLPELERVQGGEGITSRRIERFAVIAQQAGEIEVAGVELPWFDIDEREWKVARIEPRTIDVLPSQESVAEPQGGGDPVDASSSAPLTGTSTGATGFWPLISAALALGWLATAMLWWRAHAAARRQSGPQEAPSPAGARSQRGQMRQLAAACRSGDAPLCRDLLLQWGRARFGPSASGSLGALARRLPQSAGAAVDELQAHLYGSGPSQWDGSKLAAALGALREAGPAARPTNARDDLPPLFR